MTYFGFLAIFLGIPLTLLALLTYRDRRRGLATPPSLHTWAPATVIAAHVIVAVAYTTPWDNYLVATGVWWYDPDLVSGVILGWVPLEEYLFFVLQTVVTGLWLLFLARRMRFTPMRNEGKPFRRSNSRRWTTMAGGALWLGSLLLLASGWQPGTYLALILVWALPPIILQLSFGADILRHYGKLVFWALFSATLYLCIGDALAIRSGTWTIDPAQSTGLLILGLPFEEALFFLVTNTLVVFGITLALAQESHRRVPKSLLNLLPDTDMTEQSASIQ